MDSLYSTKPPRKAALRPHMLPLLSLCAFILGSFATDFSVSASAATFSLAEPLNHRPTVNIGRACALIHRICFAFQDQGIRKNDNSLGCTPFVPAFTRTWVFINSIGLF